MAHTVFPLRAFILAGGLGKRLRSVISDRPKPMAPVQGVPFLELLIASLASKRVRELVILSGYMGEAIEEYFRNWNVAEVSIQFSREEQPLGTGGAVKHAERFATEPTLLVNGDTFYDADLDELLELHFRTGADVTLSLMSVEDASRYGSVVLDDHGQVLGFHEKQEGPAGKGLINAGCSLLSREFISALPGGRPFSMEQEIFPELARSGKMFGLCRQRVFFDIGTPESYEAFKAYTERLDTRC